jgi:hypothetical protein
MFGINMFDLRFPINYKMCLVKISEKLNSSTIKICYNLLYGFSVFQLQFYKIKNIVTPKLMLLMSPIHKYLENNGLLVKGVIKMLRLIDNDGNEIHNITMSSKSVPKSIEMTCKNINYSSVVLLDKNIESCCINCVFYEKFPESFEYKLSNVKFMSIELEYNNVIFFISLNNNSDNYYIINNSLNKDFFKYYIKNILKKDVNYDNFDYIVRIIDHNVNFVTLLPYQYIVIYEDNYKIYPIENENNTSIIENILIDELASDSDKSDEFIKLDTILTS